MSNDKYYEMTNAMHKQREANTTPLYCDDLGRVALPWELLKELEAAPGEPLAIRQTGPRTLQIAAVTAPHCRLCGSGDSLFQILGSYICADCLIRMSQDFVLEREPDVPGICNDCESYSQNDQPLDQKEEQP